MTLDGNHEELQNDVVSSEFYQNVQDKSSGRFMGLYDVKNARLCERYEGEPLTKREPQIDETHFKLFTKMVDGIMTANNDVCWVLAGKGGANDEILRKEIAAKGWQSKKCMLIWDGELSRSGSLQ